MTEPRLIGHALDRSAPEHQRNLDAFHVHETAWQHAVTWSLQGGSPQAHARQRARGRFPVRERIHRLLDPGSPFLELGLLAGYDQYDGQAPSAGLVTGIGTIQGILCCVIAHDPSVKGGSYFPLTVKKHLRAQQVAQDNRLPCVYLVDSGGAYLPLQAEVFPDRQHFGRIFFNQARMSAEGIPQLAVVLGACTAGGAYIPTLADACVMVEHAATLFLAGPPLVQAATGETVDAETLGGADLHTRVSGVADQKVPDETQALRQARNWVARAAAHAVRTPALQRQPSAAPQWDPADLPALIPHDPKQPWNMLEVIARVVDGSLWEPFKPDYGTTLLTGLAAIEGYPVGILANQGVITCAAAGKATHFIQWCDKMGIPLVFLQNVTGFMVGPQAEADGIAKDGAQLITAVTCAQVPKLTVIVGGSFGAGNYGMCGRAYDPRFLWSWPNARIAVMGSEQAAFVLHTLQRSNPQSASAASQRMAQHEAESCALYASARLWDDGIIHPQDTRRVLGLGLEAVCSTPWPRTSSYGIFRM